MFVHSADKLAEMRTKFHVIQAKLIISVWCFTVQWYHSKYCILHSAHHQPSLTCLTCSILETRNAGGSSKSRSFAAAMKNTFGLLHVRVCVNQRILSADRRMLHFDSCYTGGQVVHGALYLQTLGTVIMLSSLVVV